MQRTCDFKPGTRSLNRASKPLCCRPLNFKSSIYYYRILCMICPKCQWRMCKLDSDYLADWMCFGCNSLWTSQYLESLSEDQVDQIYANHLATRKHMKAMYEQIFAKQPEEEEVLDPGRGLFKWMTNAES